jgi:outer membrane protein assembly factor BamB
MPTPIVYGDYLYTCGNNGVLTCYDAKTGERLYQQRIASQSNAFTASPIAADGRLYFAGEDGDVFVVKAGPKYELLAANPMGEVLMATPAISEGMIFVRSISCLYGIADAAAKPKAAK